MIGSRILSVGRYVQLCSDPTVKGIVSECRDERSGPFFVRMCRVRLTETLRCTCGEHEDTDEMELPHNCWEEVPS